MRRGWLVVVGVLALCLVLAGSTNHPLRLAPANVDSASASPVPMDAKAYATKFVTAWVSGDSVALAESATPDALAQLAKVPTMDTSWVDIRCAADQCVFRNAGGDELDVLFAAQGLGRPHAVTSVLGSTTVFPDEELNYVLALDAAWHQGNTQRMLALSNANVASFFADQKPPPLGTNFDVGTGMDPGAGKPIVVTWNVGDGRTFRLVVLTVRLAHAHAVDRACLMPCKAVAT